MLIFYLIALGGFLSPEALPLVNKHDYMSLHFQTNKIRIKCEGCQHSVMIPRREFEKKMKKVLKRSGE